MATGAAWLKGRNSQGGREEQKYPYKKEKERKTYLTLTGPLMEGVDVADSPRGILKASQKRRREAAENSSRYVSYLLLKFLLLVSPYRGRFSVAR